MLYIDQQLFIFYYYFYKNTNLSLIQIVNNIKTMKKKNQNTLLTHPLILLTIRTMKQLHYFLKKKENYIKILLAFHFLLSLSILKYYNIL